MTQMLAMMERPIGMTDDRVDWHLWNWSQWMRRNSHRLGYPRLASGGMGRSAHSDFDEMVQAADARCARAVDAIIEALPAAQRIAVHHKLLASVYRVRADLATSYADACDRIRRELMRKGID